MKKKKLKMKSESNCDNSYVVWNQSHEEPSSNQVIGDKSTAF